MTRRPWVAETPGKPSSQARATQPAMQPRPASPQRCNSNHRGPESQHRLGCGAIGTRAGHRHVGRGRRWQRGTRAAPPAGAGQGDGPKRPPH
eukprot:7478982-Alexandrium_andersonii.AAC.1